MKKVALLLSLYILLAIPAVAQVQFFCSQDTIPLSQTSYSAEVRISDFMEIVGTQFTFTWDSTVLAYQGLSDLSDMLSVNDHFGEDNVSSGVLRFAWYNPAVEGVSLPDSTILFTVDFEVIGTQGSSSNLVFGDSPIGREVVDTSFMPIGATYSDGLVLLNTVSSVRENTSALRIESIQPNPVTNQTPSLNFYINKTDTLLVRVVRIDGQELYRATRKVQAGQQTIRLDQSLFSQSGIYVVILQTDSFISTQKLIVNK